MEFGNSLRTARETKGYTASQLAEMTHIKASVIEGLENEDFSMIAAPIYGRGFVKLYCEAVGLEPKPFVDEFMEIMNGNREIPIRERPVPANAEPVVPTADPTPADPTPVAPPPPPAERDLFTQNEPVADKPTITDPLPKADISRYASPFRVEPEDHASAALPVLPWRLILLGVAGLAILAILVCGIRALYCATSVKPVTETETEAVEKTAPKPTAQPATKPAARTRQQNIPALYID